MRLDRALLLSTCLFTPLFAIPSAPNPTSKPSPDFIDKVLARPDIKNMFKGCPASACLASMSYGTIVCIIMVIQMDDNHKMKKQKAEEKIKNEEEEKARRAEVDEKLREIGKHNKDLKVMMDTMKDAFFSRSHLSELEEDTLGALSYDGYLGGGSSALRKRKFLDHTSKLWCALQLSIWRVVLPTPCEKCPLARSWGHIYKPPTAATAATATKTPHTSTPKKEVLKHTPSKPTPVLSRWVLHPFVP